MEDYACPKAYLYQMYFVIAKLDAPRLAKLEMVMNFGIQVDVRGIMLELMEYGGTYEDCSKVFYQIPFFQLLKIYKYLNWADKKLHSVFYIENKDDITEDLLSDFKDPDNESKFLKPAVLSQTKGIIDMSKLKD